MKIELLYFDGCPNHEQAFQNLEEALKETNTESEIEIIKVNNPEDAVAKRFLGSPSIRIEEKDLEIKEDNTTEYSMRCRRYRNGDQWQGYPSKELIKDKLLLFKNKEMRNE